MATSTDPRRDQRYLDFDEFIAYQLEKTRSSIKLTEVMTGLAGSSVLILAYLLVFVVFEHWIVSDGFGFWPRLLMLGGVMTMAVAWVVWKVVLPYLRRINSLFAARMIESADDSLKSNLLNLVDLQRSGRPIPPHIRAALEKQTAIRLQRVDIDQVVDHRPLMRLAYALLAIVVLACLYVIFSPKEISSSVWRALLPTANVAVATRTQILEVNPGETNVLARSQLPVTADLSGEIPERVTLLYSTADGKYVDEPVQMREVDGGIHQYRAVLTGDNGRGILQNVTYRIEAGDARSPDYRITVIQPPSAKVEQVRYEFPDYMNLPPETQTSGHIDTWEGTTVTITAKANMPVTSATILFSDEQQMQTKAEEIPMSVLDGTTLTARWKLEYRSDGTYPHFYRIQCTSKQGDRDPEPTVYNLTIRPDKSPDLELLDPTGDLELPANSIVPLMIVARDPDFLLRYLTLRIEKGGEQLPPQEIFEGLRKTFSGTYEWNLGSLHLKPGDVVTYWIEARDNKQPLGNRRNTPRLNIRITDPVSEEEVQERLESDKQRQDKLLEEARQNTNDGDPMHEQAPLAGTEEPPEPSPEPQNADEPPAQPPSENGAESEASGAGSQDQTGESSGQNGDESSQKVNPDDVTDDAETIRRIYEYQQQQKKGEPDPGGDQQPQDQQQSDGSDPDKAPPQPNQDSPNNPPDGNPGDNRNGQDNPSDSHPPMDNQNPEHPKDPSQDSSDSGNPGNPGNQGAGQTEQGNRNDGQSDQGGSSGNPSTQEGNDPTGENNQTGNGNQDSQTDPTDRGGAQQQSETPAGGEERPTNPSAGAEQRKADGDETGVGRPDHDPNADPTPAQNPDQIQREDGTEPAVRPGENKSDQPAAQQRKPNGKSGANPNAAQSPQSKSEENPEGASDQQSRPSDERNGSRPADRANDQPMPRNDPMNDEEIPQGRDSEPPRGDPTNDRQPPGQADSPGDPAEGGEGGESAGQPAAGDQPSQNQQPAPSGDGDSQSPSQGESEGQPGGEPSSSGSQPNGDPNQGMGQGGTPGEPTEQNPDNPSSQGSGSGAPTGPSGNETGNPTQGGAPQSADGEGSEGGGQGQHAPQAEEPNLEYARQATNLVLKRLQDELERGEVDPQLLEELGWTESDMKKFAERLQRQLNESGSADSPESMARRRQFEETLKNLDLDSTLQMRRDSQAPKKSIDSIGPRNLPTPAEYREAAEAYLKSLSRRQEAGSK